MCDYSLHDVASRPAKVGDKLVSTQFPNAITRGFADPAEPRVAVCLMPGTEVAFEKEVECDASFRFLPTRKSTHKVARFRQVNLNRPAAHHDALEFPDGKIVLVTDLCEGQSATVLQTDAGAEVPEVLVDVGSVRTFMAEGTVNVPISIQSDVHASGAQLGGQIRNTGSRPLEDATIVRGILLPASMKLLGERNWYLPKKLGWLPKLHHEPATLLCSPRTDRSTTLLGLKPSGV
jgi:hypothetical protein